MEVLSNDNDESVTPLENDSPAYEEADSFSPALEPMDTIYDVDEDEAFINDLMSMHPNGDDLVVEDLEVTEALTSILQVDDLSD